MPDGAAAAMDWTDDMQAMHFSTAIHRELVTPCGGGSEPVPDGPMGHCQRLACCSWTVSQWPWPTRSRAG
jgi:hypothetical protein